MASLAAGNKLIQNTVSSAFHTDVQWGQHVLSGAYDSRGLLDGFLNSGYFVTMTYSIECCGGWWVMANGWTMLPRNSNANENVWNMNCRTNRRSE